MSNLRAFYDGLHLVVAGSKKEANEIMGSKIPEDIWQEWGMRRKLTLVIKGASNEQLEWWAEKTGSDITSKEPQIEAPLSLWIEFFGKGVLTSWE